MLVAGLTVSWWFPESWNKALEREKKTAGAAPAAMAAKLAETRAETAAAILDQGRPDEALAMLVSALREDSTAENARELAELILRGNVWHFPDLVIRHPMPVERLAFHAPSTLWVGMAGETSTIVRWDIDDPAIESVLFPVEQSVPRSMVVDPTARRMVVERAGVLVLCDAESLKPVMDLGELPQDLTPESVIGFSADGLLMAHPAVSAEGSEGMIWFVRDAGSGQVLRSHEAGTGEDPATEGRALSASLDRFALRVLHEDGSVTVIPVSPVEDAHVESRPQPLNLPYAQFSADGRSWLALADRGPHQPRELVAMPENDAAGMESMLEEFVWRFPWSRQPGVWNGLLRELRQAPVQVEDRILRVTGSSLVPIRVASNITAVAMHGDLAMLGCEDGTFIRYRLLPLPESSAAGTRQDDPPDAASIDAFAGLAAALSGVVYDDSERRFVAVGEEDRLRMIGACDPGALGRLFPALDFSGTIAAMSGLSHREAGPASLGPLRNRLARYHAGPEDADPAVQAFLLALESPCPESIAESFTALDDPPPLPRMLAEFRIAWLEERMADAFSAWPEQPPDLEWMRLTRDMDGWEHVDFGALLDRFQKPIDAEYEKFELANGATDEQRQELFERLIDPETARMLGRPRLAGFCLRAAESFSAHEEDTERGLVLATIAYNFGADPAASLRAIAHAHAALGQFEQAHDHWIQLITEQPAASHEPSDYAEAAYTAFENNNPAQAMEILLTGIRLFPEDPDFALRAGWIALLTGHSEHAYRFLLTGNRAGYPADVGEHATVLLAIAAAQCGEVMLAYEFYEELTGINPDWADPETIEALQWPEELKSTLRQLTW